MSPEKQDRRSTTGHPPCTSPEPGHPTEQPNTITRALYLCTCSASRQGWHVQFTVSAPRIFDEPETCILESVATSRAEIGPGLTPALGRPPADAAVPVDLVIGKATKGERRSRGATNFGAVVDCCFDQVLARRCRDPGAFVASSGDAALRRCESSFRSRALPAVAAGLALSRRLAAAIESSPAARALDSWCGPLLRADRLGQVAGTEWVRPRSRRTAASDHRGPPADRSRGGRRRFRIRRPGP